VEGRAKFFSSSSSFSFLFSFYLTKIIMDEFKENEQMKPYKIDPKTFLEIDPTKTTIKLRLDILSPKYNKGPNKVSSGVVTQTQLSRGHELGQEACMPCMDMPSSTPVNSGIHARVLYAWGWERASSLICLGLDNVTGLLYHL